ncbi:H-type small acid-soluble spore protein [Bacillota bacterium Lsc_1132]
MDKNRAKEIVNSPNMIKVTYDGAPIYIQHVHDNDDTARIYPLDHPENEKNVPVSSLVEQESSFRHFSN